MNRKQENAMEGRWGDGAPGSDGYFSHAVGPPIRADVRAAHDALTERGLRLHRIAQDAKNGPVVQAMARWVEGERVPSFDEQIETFGIKYADFLYAMGFGKPLTMDILDETVGITAERHEFIRRYCFAVPTKEALDSMSGGKLLEIGAGSGAWAKLLALRGVDVIATDASFESFGFEIGSHFPVEKLQGKTAVRRWPDRNVFCAWPSLNKTWLRQAARAMRPGRTLFVVTEPAAADERTWDYIETAFEKTADLDLIGWHSCHDRFQVWRKLGRRQRRAQAERQEDRDDG